MLEVVVHVHAWSHGKWSRLCIKSSAELGLLHDLALIHLWLGLKMLQFMPMLRIWKRNPSRMAQPVGRRSVHWTGLGMKTEILLMRRCRLRWSLEHESIMAGHVAGRELMHLLHIELGHGR